MTAETVNVNALRGKIVAVLLGITLFFALPFISSYIFGPYSSWYLALAIALQAVSGAALGFVWPHLSWRLGLWLFAIWPPMLLVMLFLGADAVTDWRREAFSLLAVLLILLAGCLGGWLGGSSRQGGEKNRPLRRRPAEVATQHRH